MAEVVLKDVSKTYPNGVQALSDLDLRVADGELVVLLGPSGCGKTTTLRLIAGLEEPTAGAIAIGGQHVRGVPAQERNVALVFQRSTLYPHVDVRRNLLYGIMLRRGRNWLGRLLLWWFRPEQYRRFLQEDRGVEERMLGAAKTLGLTDVLDQRPNQLSGGQQQRVALGRALVREPGVFLLDEPLSNLDGALRAELRHELHLLQRRLRATMVYVTHDQAEAMTLGDRLVLMKQGVVQQVGPPRAVYERPANLFVAGFLGWPSMNFIDGQLVSCNGRLCFARSEWSLPVPVDKEGSWGEHAGKPVTLGVRAEHLRLGEVGEAKLAMELVLVESIGHSVLVTLRRADVQITARLVDSDDLGDTNNTSITFLMEHAHLFDGSTGLAISQGRPAG
jgi:multiple sugar transport system ATP-binding protein